MTRLSVGSPLALRCAAAMALLALTATKSIAAPMAPAGSAPSNLASTAATEAHPVCRITPNLDRLDHPLARVSHQLEEDRPIKIVAIGSSSTAGAGASSPAANYPSRLEAELTGHFLWSDTTVVNRGVNGEEAPDMLARFDTDVIAEKPDLVIWQTGTNSVLRDRPLDPKAKLLHQGVERLKAAHADVILLDPQYAPKVIAKSDAESMVTEIAVTAKEENVDLFRRFALMRRWYQNDHMPFETFVSPDGLHMNDWSYSCLAKRLGAAIVEAATRPTATASRPLH